MTKPMSDIPNELVWGFHGTTATKAVDIDRDRLMPSENEWDWLGHGIYFWERDFERATSWASDEDQVVYAAVIDLSRCLDLTQIQWRQFVTEVGQAAPPAVADGLTQNEYNRSLDCWVINQVVEQWRGEDGTPRFTTVRGAFQEGDPIYRAGTDLAKKSAIRSLDHVQICVVDDSAILNVLRLPYPTVLD
ncbi:hypothetical protein ACWDHH_15725 [Janibacter hoylei]